MIIASIVIILIALMLSIYKFIKSDEKIPYFVLIIAIFISSIPILYPYYINANDTKWYMLVLESMRLNILNRLQFPLRISYNILYGGQHHIFYPLKMFYIPILIEIVSKANEIVSFNIFLLFLSFLSCFIMYFVSLKFFNNKFVSIACSIFYVLNSYRLSNLYAKFAIGESIVFCFTPLLIYSIYQIFFNNSKRWWQFVIAATLIYQHNMLCTYLYFVLIVIFLIYYIINIRDLNRLLIFFKASILIFLLNAWLLFPQIYEMLYIDFINPTFYQGIDLFNFRHPTTLSSFFNLFPSYRIIDTLGFFIVFSFILSLLIIIIVILYNFLFKNKINKNYLDINDKYFKIAFLFIVIGVISYILSFKIIPYEVFKDTFLYKPIYVLQFRTRFFHITSPFMTMGISYLFYKIIISIINMLNYKHFTKMVNYLYLLLIIIIASISSISYINNVMNNAEFLQFVRPTVNMDYFLTNTLPEKQFNYDYNIIKSTEDIVIDNLKRNYYNFDLDYEVINYDNTKLYYIDMPLFDYPVYKVTDENGNTIEYEKGINNLLRIRIDNNKGKFSIRQIEPLFWLIGDFISLITIICIAIYLIYTKIYIKKLKK